MSPCENRAGIPEDLQRGRGCVDYVSNTRQTQKRRKNKHLDEKEASYMCNTDDDVNLERQWDSGVLVIRAQAGVDVLQN